MASTCCETRAPSTRSSSSRIGLILHAPKRVLESRRNQRRKHSVQATHLDPHCRVSYEPTIMIMREIFELFMSDNFGENVHELAVHQSSVLPRTFSSKFRETFADHNCNLIFDWTTLRSQLQSCCVALHHAFVPKLCCRLSVSK